MAKNNSNIIAIHGLAGSGKDTLAAMIREYSIERYLEPCDLLAFADPVKICVEQITGVHMIYANGKWDYTHEQKQETPEGFDKTIGELLQHFGTDVVRDTYGEDVWINRTMERTGVVPCIITDVRFHNELAACRKVGAFAVHVSRPDAELSGRPKGHRSEVGLLPCLFDVCIVNDGSLEDLRYMALRIVESLRNV